MDNLTHTLAGLALAEAGLKRTTRLAGVTLLIAANLPDLDGLVYLFGSGTDGLVFRRGWTHGVLAMLLLPPLLLLAMLGWHRLRGRPSGLRADRLLLVAALGVWSHPLLDLLNTYGVRLLMPFSGRWFYGDALFIVDPWVWLALLLGIVLSRRRQRAAAAAAGRPVRIALAVVAGYALLMAFGSAAAARRIEPRSPAPGRRTLASPVFGNPLRRAVVRELDGSYERGELRLLPWRYQVYDRAPSGRDTPAALAAARVPAGAAFLGWARFPVFRSVTADSGLDVTISDARYEGRGTRSWASVTVRVPLAGTKEGL
ncbi:MAG TPA: metal-dependent hydrolase [Gemmatimonadales bacterium]|nr:metal-dependent hydrolase [Gemmatimonadales bacterium]